MKQMTPQDNEHLPVLTRESEEAHSVSDAFPDPCFVIARDGAIVSANEAAAAALQKPKAAFVGKQFVSLLYPSSRPGFSTALATCFAEKQRQHCTLMLNLPNGIAHDIDVSLSTYSTSGRQEDSLCLSVVRDISAEKQKDIDLLRFSNVAHYTLNPLEITDVDGRIIYVNPAFERASGYSKEEMIGKNPSIFGSGKHPKSFWENMWKTIRRGRNRPAE